MTKEEIARMRGEMGPKENVMIRGCFVPDFEASRAAMVRMQCTGTIGAMGYQPGTNGFDDGEPCPCEWEAHANIQLGAIEMMDEDESNCPECGAEGEQV